MTAPRTVRQRVLSSDKVLILGSSVAGGLGSREAVAVQNLAPSMQIDVVTPEQWTAMTAEDFMSYRVLVLGDAACASGTAAFQAAIDTRSSWGAIVDGVVALVSTDPTSNDTPQLVESGLEFVLGTAQYSTGMYISLGCAYQDAPAGTAVPLLEPFGDFEVEGVPGCADSAHMFAMDSDVLSRNLFDALLSGSGGCAARSVFTHYPEQNFAYAALAMSSVGAPIPGERVYTDYTYDWGNPTSFTGTPYILVRGATAFGAGCGIPDQVAVGEDCDLGDFLNGNPALNQPPEETCSWSCHQHWCGDGYVDTDLGEECDNGINNGRTQDAMGDIGTCTSFCKVPHVPQPNHPPAALCQDVTVLATNTCGMSADVNNGSYDVDNDLVGCTPSPAGPYDIGSTTVTLTCTDQRGNSGTCTGVVTVADKGPPTVTLVAPVSQSLECIKSGTYTDPGYSATDLCEGSLPQSSVTRTGSVNMGASGSYTLSYQATDSAGNVSAAVTRSVSVVDTLAPVLTRNGSEFITRECGGSYMEQGAMAYDQCDGNISAKVVRTGSVNTSVIGDYVLHFNVRDTANNAAAEVTRTVSIRDTTSPTVTLNAPTAQTAECAGTYVDPGATATDTCAGSLPATVNSSTLNMAVPGSYTINYKATDPSGNVGISADRSVTVSDTQGPTVTLVAPVSQSLECIKGGTYTDPGYSATDLCEGPLPQSSVTRTGAVNMGASGSYSLAYQAADSVGNTSAAVTRSVSVVDTMAPVLTRNGSEFVTRECGGSYMEQGAMAYDQCDGNISAKVVRTGSVNTGVVGDYVLHFNVKDTANNAAAEVTRTVSIVDTTGPTVTLNAPTTQTAECGGPYPDPGATATDSCAGSLPATVNSSTLNMGALGSYTINYKATDPSGNVGISANRSVTVSDTLPPAITLNGSANMSLECATAFTDPGATAIDQCFGNVSSAIVRTGTLDNKVLGAQTLHYNVKDPQNNAAAEVTRTVTVRDTVPPIITLLGSSAQAVECGSAYADPGATALDACAGSVPAVATTTADPSTPGSYVVSYTATDPSGNSVSLFGARTVTVSDTQPPTLTLNGSATPSLECGSPYADPGATALDACFGDISSRITLTGSVNSGAPGSYTLTYNVTDPAGQSAPPVSRTVTVADTLPPSITVLGSLNTQVECGTPYTDPGATASDVCLGNLTASITTTGSVDTAVPGDYTVTYSVADFSYHEAIASRSVAVRDTLPPQIQVLPGPSVLPCNGSPYVDPGATATDLCAGDLTSSISVSSDLNQSQTGQYTVTYMVTDPAGNTSTATRDLTVQGTEIHLNDFNVFLLEDYTNGHDVQGKVAAGGNISMTNFTVGAGLPEADISQTLVAGGDLSLSQGGIWGDTYYGGTYTASSDVILHRGTLAQGTPINFVARFTELRNLSSQLAGMAANGTTTRESWGGLMLSGTDPSLNVFTVNASDFSGATMLYISAPANSMAVLNIRGNPPLLTGFGISFGGGIDQRTVLYNFPDATSISTQGLGILGTLLAPNARLTINSGSWDGGIYAVSLTGDGEGHISPLPDRSFCQ